MLHLTIDLENGDGFSVCGVRSFDLDQNRRLWLYFPKESKLPAVFIENVKRVSGFSDLNPYRHMKEHDLYFH